MHFLLGLASEFKCATKLLLHTTLHSRLKIAEMGPGKKINGSRGTRCNPIHEAHNYSFWILPPFLSCAVYCLKKPLHFTHKSKAFSCCALYVTLEFSSSKVWCSTHHITHFAQQPTVLSSLTIFKTLNNDSKISKLKFFQVLPIPKFSLKASYSEPDIWAQHNWYEKKVLFF